MAHTIELKKVSKYYATEESVSMGFSRVDLSLDIGEFVAIRVRAAAENLLFST